MFLVKTDAQKASSKLTQWHIKALQGVGWMVLLLRSERIQVQLSVPTSSGTQPLETPDPETLMAPSDLHKHLYPCAHEQTHRHTYVNNKILKIYYMSWPRDLS